MIFPWHWNGKETSLHVCIAVSAYVVLHAVFLLSCLTRQAISDVHERYLRSVYCL